MSRLEVAIKDGDLRHENVRVDEVGVVRQTAVDEVERRLNLTVQVLDQGRKVADLLVVGEGVAEEGGELDGIVQHRRHLLPGDQRLIGPQREADLDHVHELLHVQIGVEVDGEGDYLNWKREIIFGLVFNLNFFLTYGNLTLQCTEKLLQVLLNRRVGHLSAVVRFGAKIK